MGLALFSAGGTFRFLYHDPGESQQRIIVWHRGPGAYLNESRITLIALSIGFIRFAFGLHIEAALYPEYTFLPLAALTLSIRGSLARRKIADIDRRMTPVALSPRTSSSYGSFSPGRRLG